MFRKSIVRGLVGSYHTSSGTHTRHSFKTGVSNSNRNEGKNSHTAKINITMLYKKTSSDKILTKKKKKH